jgi:hypothetical protein
VLRFYSHLGYAAVLTLQWVHDPGAADAQIARLERGCLAGFAASRGAFGGIPQLFLSLPQPDAALARAAEREAPGCVAGFTMVKELGTRAVTPGPTGAS